MRSETSTSTYIMLLPSKMAVRLYLNHSIMQDSLYNLFMNEVGEKVYTILQMVDCLRWGIVLGEDHRSRQLE
jgi:hypothetical protein